ncbi:MAG: 1-acyl-sn-glycerol-3-phosphate acyltransferase, partial [Vicinamibacterales bacterium]
LTETAPIVTLNHPFRTSSGSVGKPIAGVEIRIAADGEVLVRGENVTSGYYASETKPGFVFSEDEGKRSSVSFQDTVGRTLDEEGWLHTGDVGELDGEGRLFIRGRKKEVIITPEGLNVYPDDVEQALERVAGVRESAVVGFVSGGEERVHAVLVVEPGTDPARVVRAANDTLQDHQRIRGVSVWTAGALPRTEGTKKLRRQAIREWVTAGASPVSLATSDDALQALVARFSGASAAGENVSLADLGLSSLERVELMVALEDRFQTRIDETKFAQARTLDELRTMVEQSSAAPELIEPVDFPAWNRRRLVALVRRLSLATWILPLARVFAWIEVEGREHLGRIDAPVVFAANHQSHFDVPVILAALPGHLRSRVAPAMAKEFFKAHFFPEGEPWRRIFTRRLNYYLAAFFFNAFPLPQREAGARQTLRYIGEIAADGFSVLLFPEGARSEAGDIKEFRGGIGMIGSRLSMPVVPVRIEGVDKILHMRSMTPTPGRVSVRFGRPLHLAGDDYAALAMQVEEAVRRL